MERSCGWVSLPLALIPIRATSRKEVVCDFCPLSPYMQRLEGEGGEKNLFGWPVLPVMLRGLEQVSNTWLLRMQPHSSLVLSVAVFVVQRQS